MHHYLLSMRKLLEKYYNINYYCTYKLLFFIFERMLNPFYWLSLSKWDNRYIKRGISMAQKQEAAEMHKGINGSIIIWSTNTPCIISFWMLCLVCLACIKIFRVELLSVLNMIVGNIFLCILCFAIIVLFLYYANRIFLFKHDKYRKYFAEFDKKKKYLLYYSIYVVSLIVQLATFYLLLSSA